MNWTDEDPSKGKEVFDWLVSRRMFNVASVMVTECLCTVRQFEEEDIWYSEENDEVHQKCLNALRNVSHVLAGGDESKLLPLLQSIECIDNQIPEDSGSGTEWLALRALRTWHASFPPDSEIPPASSGEWLQLWDADLEVACSDDEELGEDDEDFEEALFELAKLTCKDRLGSLFQNWRILPPEEQRGSFSIWLQSLYPPTLTN